MPSREPAAPQTTADRDTAAACAGGSLEAFEELYRRHGARMKSVAANLLGNSDDAEDAVQDAFLKIYRNAGRFRGEAQLSTWIYRILVNACYDLMRTRRRRSAEAPELDRDAAEARVVAGAPEHPLRLQLERSLARLKPQRRAVFLLFEVEGFKHREIAEILEIPEGTSKNLLFEAKQELLRLLQDPRTRSRDHERRM